MLTHVPHKEPYEIPTEFDPNLALAIIWGKDLAEAEQRGLPFSTPCGWRAKTARASPSNPMWNF